MTTASTFQQQRGLWAILSQGTMLYGRHWWAVTRPFICPIISICLGIVVWIGLAYTTIEVVTQRFPTINVWILWGLFLLSNVPGVWLFLKGFWRYMVWLSAISLTIRELVETQQCQDYDALAMRITSRSTDYSVILLFFFSILFFPLVLAMIPIIIGGGSLIANLLGLGTFVVTSLVAVLAMVILTPIFQVFAFTPSSAGATLFETLDLVRHGIVKTIVIVILFAVVTQTLLPLLFNIICELLWVNALLAKGLTWCIHFFLDANTQEIETAQTHYPLLSQLFTLMRDQTQAIALSGAQSITLSISAALFIPLGSCWLSLLYGHLKATKVAN